MRPATTGCAYSQTRKSRGVEPISDGNRRTTTRLALARWRWRSAAILLLVPRQVKRKRGFTHLSPKRQITLPISVVERAGLRIGEELAVEADDEGRVIVSRSAGETVGDRRRRALRRAAGALPGVWPTDALDELRDEWR